LWQRNDASPSANRITSSGNKGAIGSVYAGNTTAPAAKIDPPGGGCGRIMMNCPMHRETRTKTNQEFRPGLRPAARRYPFGEGNNADNDEFATYRKDTSTQHECAWHRFYSATWGRFSSPDPYVMSGGLTNPQGWNRYSYVANDPVNYNDPTGLVMYWQPPKPPAQTQSTLPIGIPHVWGWAIGFYMNLGTVTLESDMGWGENSGGSTPTPHEAASMIGEEVRAGKLTDCEGLAMFATYAGTYYAGTKEEFVRSFGVFVPANHPMVKLVNLIAGGAIASSPDAIPYRPYGGRSGFKSEYRDSLAPTSDQVHHFAAYFQFGFIAGALEGEFAAYLTDWNNPGDINLGVKASELGAALKLGVFKAADLSKKIQEILCK
jgi:RHS repeat-associated protein